MQHTDKTVCVSENSANTFRPYVNKNRSSIPVYRQWKRWTDLCAVKHQYTENWLSPQTTKFTFMNKTALIQNCIKLGNLENICAVLLQYELNGLSCLLKM